jgi:cyclopropane fatty-acyl-phospholipid synthase-like methyltransferase
MSVGPTTSTEFFERKYRQSDDPWKFASSEYELGRYRAILDALRGRRYERAFEPGCSIGVLTAEMAKVCGQVVAMDLSETAVERARERCRELPNVEIRVGSVAEAMPEGEFDLVVLSEIGYYFGEEELREWSLRLLGMLQHGGTLLGVHWLGTSEDHLRSGDDVHQTLRTVADELGLRLEEERRAEGFRLDRGMRR